MRDRTSNARAWRVSEHWPFIAAIIAAAMMFVCAVPSLMPQLNIATAADADPGICMPTVITVGENSADTLVDTGVATWVNGDMYVGANNGNSAYDVDMPITGSYATEAQGLTVVNGSLAIRGLNSLSDNRGFHFGVSADGSFFAPAAGSDILAVGGSNSSILLTDSARAASDTASNASNNENNDAGESDSSDGASNDSTSTTTAGADDATTDSSTHDAADGAASNTSDASERSDAGTNADGATSESLENTHNSSDAGSSSGESVHVMAWAGVNGEGRGWIGATAQAENSDENSPLKATERSYTATFAGNESRAAGTAQWDSQYTSVYVADEESTISWNASDVLKSVKVGNESKDLSDYQSTVESLAADLSNRRMNDGNAVSTSYAPADNNYVRKNYDDSATYTFNFSDTTEKLITFTGDGTSMTQVFELDANELQNGDANGIDFAFEDIPDGAAIVINVTGATSIDFNNGWRVWFNGEEIGNAYRASESDSAAGKAYATAAQSILWNFVDTQNLVIRGGNADYADLEQNKEAARAAIKQAAANDSDANNANTGANADVDADTADDADVIGSASLDDPAAAMLGTILIAHGSFESHVTTNGRVWVGKDFSMSNPTAATNTHFVHGDSASVLDMDQTRRNYPWIGITESTSCAAIAWNKVSPEGEALGNTTWGVYGSLADAAAQRDAIVEVTDNDLNSGDVNADDGAFEVGRLNPENRYFIRELATGNTDYTLNERVYEITAGQAGAVYSDITNVYGMTKVGASGSVSADLYTELTLSTDKALTNDGAIVNFYRLGEVKWANFANGDDTYTGLEGSTWTLTNVGDGSTWNVVDTTEAAQTVTILNSADENVTDTTLPADMGTSLDLHASVQPNAAAQSVTWTSSEPSVVAVTNGTVFVRDAFDDESKTVTITATSVSDPTKSANVRIKPQAVEVTSLEISYNGLPVTDVIAKDVDSATFQLKAATDPSDIRVIWASSDTRIATVDQNGRVTPVSHGSATITAYAGQKRASVTLEINDPNVTTVYFNTAKWPDHADYYYYGQYATRDGSSSWGFQKMTPACGTWVQASVSANLQSFEFVITSTDDAAQLTGENVYKSTDDTNFTVGVGRRDVHIDALGKLALGMPSCPTNTDEEASDGTNTQSGTSDSRVSTDSADSASASDSDSSAAGSLETSSISGTDVTSSDTSSTAPSKSDVLSDIEDTTFLADATPSTTDAFSAAREAAQHSLIDTADSAGSTGSADGNGNTATEDEGNATETSTDDSNDADKPTDSNTTSTGTSGRDDANGVWEDVASEPGKFKLIDVPDGTYTLTQASAPSGYKLNSATYAFTVNNSEVSWDNGSSVPDSIDSEGYAWISSDPTEVIWSKVDADVNDNKLSGSVESLEQFQYETITTADGTVEQAAVGSYQTIASEISDCVSDDACDTSNPYADVDEDAGEFKLVGLPEGWYRLSESESPDGYDSDIEYYYYFEITSETSNASVSANDANSGNDEAQITLLRASDEYVPTSGAPVDAVALSNNSITTDKRTGSATWTVVENGDDTNLLAGSSWRVEYEPDDLVSTDVQAATVVINDCVASDTSNATCNLADENYPTWAVDTDPSGGSFELKNLPWGTYTITMESAPIGYSTLVSNESDEFVIGLVTTDALMLLSADEALDSTTPVAQVLATTFVETYSATNEINTTTILPSSGGFQLDWRVMVLIGGITVLLITMLGFAVDAKRAIVAAGRGRHFSGSSLTIGGLTRSQVREFTRGITNRHPMRADRPASPGRRSRKP